MLKNYFKIAFRNLLKHRLHTGINLIGLSVGLGVGILVFFFVQFELSYDNFHPENEKIFRVMSHEMIDGEMTESFSTPMVIEPVFRSEFPQIDKLTGIINGGVQAILPDETSQNQDFLMVHSDFLEIFGFKLIQGEISAQLKDKYSIVITKTLASKYFGYENPIGKTIQMKMGQEYQDYRVSGILDEIPANSSLKFEMLMPVENMDYFSDREGMDSWFNVWGQNFIKLKSAEQVTTLEESMDALMQKSLGEAYVKDEYYFTFHPISEMHFSQAKGNGGLETTKASLLWILAAIALLVLLIACINFTTMAVGRSITRAKEVGVRKTMGANFKQLVFQFLTESFLITLLATIIGVLLAQMILPTFNNLFDKQLVLDFGLSQVYILFALLVFITLLSGAYPSFFLSALQPIKVLKGSLSIHFGKQGLRKGLVAFQFFISFLLIASTLVMYNQMWAIRNFDLGFDKDQIVVIDTPNFPSNNFGTSIKEGFKKAQLYHQALSNRSEISSSGITMGTYGDNAYWEVAFPLEDGKRFNFRVNFIGGDYLETLGLDLVEGRKIDPSPAADSSAVLVNRKFAEMFEWQDPTGELLPNTAFAPHQIVGVVDDFHFASLYQPIEPLLIAKSPDLVFSGIDNLMIRSGINPKLLVKANTSDFAAFQDILESEWEKIYPGEVFQLSFLDETIQQQYVSEERLGKMVLLASMIAVLIAFMGLFAMVAMSISGRMKEIGIRKVLGASGWSISWMMNREFIFITLLGAVLALPLSWYVMQDWISQFAVRQWPSWFNFLLILMAGLILVIGIVTGQSIRAAQMNPVDTLKDE